MFHLGHHTEWLVYHIKTSKASSSYFLLLFHHVLTIFMIAYSYMNKCTPWGFAIFFMNDISEIPLNISRFFNEITYTKNIPMLICFIFLNIIWFTNWVYCYNWEVLIPLFKKFWYEDISDILYLYVMGSINLVSLSIMNLFW